jgi:BAI1-associated protein 2-like protein 1
VETVTSRQSEIQKFIADGRKEALLEEKRRFCFLVDKHCSFASHIHYYHMQVSVRHIALSVPVALSCTEGP